MFLLDIFKGIIPEGLIKINVDQRKIIIKDSELIIGDKTINDPKIIDKVFDKISQYKNDEFLPFQLIHENLADEYNKYEELALKDKEKLKLLKKVLPEEEIECILMARRVVLAYEDNKNNKNNEFINKLNKQLDCNYPKKGKKIKNWISTGYFDNLIIPFIDIFKSEHGEEEYKEKFFNFYNELLKFFPIAVFVSTYTSEDKLEEELNKRLNLKSIPFIRVHTINSDNIKKVENIRNKLGLDEKYTTTDKRYITPSETKAQIYEIKIKT